MGTMPPYYAKSGADGRFTLPELPEGRYRLRVWHEGLGTVKTGVPETVTVVAGEPLREAARARAVRQVVRVQRGVAARRLIGCGRQRRHEHEHPQRSQVGQRRDLFRHLRQPARRNTGGRTPAHVAPGLVDRRGSVPLRRFGRAGA